MCAIIGKVNIRDNIVLDEFHFLRDSMTHRGPDGFGTEILLDGRLALGHRRLSIIDLSVNGKQPMCNEDQSVWLTFNGEIYNFQHLRHQLDVLGHQFNSDTDSEVLIHGYESWGIEGLLDRVKGMFAFCIYDKSKNKLILARDRFGMKPLYYSHSSNSFSFASEIKGISKKERGGIKHSSLADYFIYSYVPNPNSIWSNIKKVEPAHYIEFDLTNWRANSHEYWKLSTGSRVISDKEAVEYTNELIYSSTKEHLTSDVPVGLFLSGGYDSSILLKTMKDLDNDTLTFNIGFQGSDRSEHRQAEEISKCLGANHKYELVGDKMDSFEILRELMYYYDDPFAVSSMIPYYLVSKLAAQNVKVALAGDGGDEAFAGYNWHYNVDNYFRSLGITDKLRVLINGKASTMTKLYNAPLTGVIGQLQQHRVLPSDLMDLVNQRNVWLFEKNLRMDLDPVKAFQYLDYKTFIPEPSLTRADRSSMANSLEVRVPFLDHKIFEFLFSLETSVYFKPPVKKVLLYENLKSHLPDSILAMPKRGFSFLSMNSLFDERFLDLMHNGYLNQHSLLSKHAVIEKLPKELKYHLLCLELWFTHHYN